MASLSFLDLPLQARLRIYSNLGLVRPCPIDLTTDQTASAPPNSRRHAFGDSSDDCFYRMRRGRRLVLGRSAWDCYCPKLPLELLLICREIRQEAFGIFYGRNKFVLRGHTEADLALLSRMSVKALRTMTSLLIRLNCWPCPRGHEGHTSHDGRCAVCLTPTRDADLVLNSASETGHILVQRWKSACNHLSSAISPGQLKLTFICDVTDLASGEKVVEPLLTLPILKQCTIRLGRQQNADLRKLAEKTCRRMTNDYIPLPGFPYLQLPQELRLQILNFTDLGPGAGYLDQFCLLCIQDNMLVKKYETSQTQLSTCCSECTDTFADCCCPTMHGSHATSCKCREFPSALFSVNRQMYQDALEAFYMNACFEFVESPMEVLSFLTRRPRNVLRFVRKIIFRVQPRQFFGWSNDGQLQHWKSLAAFIKDNFNISNLSIVIDSEEMYDHCMEAEREEDNRFYYEASREIADAMCILRGIRDIHFRLAWFVPMGPIFARSVMGDGYIDRHSQKKPTKPTYEMEWRVPSWHNTSLPDS